MQRHLVIYLVALLMLTAGYSVPAHAQQLGTDDAALAVSGSCDIEGWTGAETWLMPACHVVESIEIIPGIGWSYAGDETVMLYELQLKTVFLDVEGQNWGIALVAGTGPLPVEQLQRPGERDQSFYLYTPLGVNLGDTGITLHSNVGVAYSRTILHVDGEAHRGFHYPLLWSFRGDIPLGDRFTAVGELVGEDMALPEFQVGVRSDIIHERLETKLTYTGSTDPDIPNLGILIGLSWSTPSFL